MLLPRPHLFFTVSATLTVVATFCAGVFAQESNPNAIVDDQLLPTGRSLSPAGQQFTFFGRPVDLIVGVDNATLFVKDRNLLRAVDIDSFEEIDSATIPGGASLWGLAVDKGGNVYVSNAGSDVHVFRLRDRRELHLASSLKLPTDSFPCGLCISPDAESLFVCLSKKNVLAQVDLKTQQVVRQIPVGIAPFDVVVHSDHLWVTNMGGRRARPGDLTATSAATPTVVDERGIANTGAVTSIPLKDLSNPQDIVVGRQPSVMAFNKHRIFVCNTNDDTITALDPHNRQSQLIDAKPDVNLPFGSMPSSAHWLTNDDILLVSLAGNNAVAVFSVDQQGTWKAGGYIPTAWYPAAIASTAKYLFVANIKGLGSRTQRRDENKGRNSHDHLGVIQRIDRTMLTQPDTMERWSAQVRKNFRLAQILRNQRLALNRPDVAPIPIPKQLGDPSIFKHVIYVIKENRTFDQVFGDYREARSSAELCLFPRKITPNHHALADRFGILDNYYCNGILSADGHSWATEGNVTPYLERAFGGFRRSYTFGNDPLTYSSSGFIWDRFLDAGLSFRNYGEMDYAKAPAGLNYQDIFNKFTNQEPLQFEQNIGIERLRRYSCRDYPGWNMNIPDVLRVDRFLKDFERFKDEGNLPNMLLVYLPQDHLGAAGVTSEAHMADNDLALGRLVEAVSQSDYWKDTVIFVNEDDPQNGFDHIDGHRSICLVISPYSKPGVNHHFYNQTSVLRTMLHLFGLPPLNQQDASAPLMRECFGIAADLSPYRAIKPSTPLNAAPGEQSSWSPLERRWREALETVPIERTGMKTEFDEDNLNRFIWHDVRGWDTPYPSSYAGAHGKGLNSLGLKIVPQEP